MKRRETITFNVSDELLGSNQAKGRAFNRNIRKL